MREALDYMSIKVWAKNTDTGEVMHINSIDKTYKGKMVCLDENCGEILNICIGDKNKPYFSHSKNCTCNGGGVETLLHLLSKQILSKCKTFVLPEESIIFRGKTLVFNPRKTIMVRETSGGEVLEKGFKTGIKICDYVGGVYYIEPSVRGITSARRQAYRKHGANVIEIDLRKFAYNDNIDEPELREYICGDTGIKSFICSPNILRVSAMIHKAEFSASGDYICCPAYLYEGVVTKKGCQSCPFYMYTKDGVMTCSGNEYYSEVVDFRIDNKELRREKYSELIPKPVWLVDKKAMLKPFGVCEKCGRKKVICTSTKTGNSIDGIPEIYWSETHYAYIGCPACKTIKGIVCPRCGNRMTICKNNRTGTIFLVCDDVKCKTSITLYDSEPCNDNYSDELLTVGTLQNYLNNFDKCNEMLIELRKSHK